MKNVLAKILIFVALTVFSTGCGLCKKVKTDPNAVMYSVTMTLNERQLDSMCTVDMIPRDFEEWLNLSFVDYETNTRVAKYSYIKVLEENNELIYIATQKGELYKVVKRMVETE